MNIHINCGFSTTWVNKGRKIFLMFYEQVSFVDSLILIPVDRSSAEILSRIVELGDLQPRFLSRA